MKDIIIVTLRQYISNENNYKHLVDHEVILDNLKKLHIYDATPEVLIDWPSIIISGGNGQLTSAGIGGDFATELYDAVNGELVGYRYGGMYDLSINIEIRAFANTEQEILNDLLSTALRLHLRRKIESQGVLVKSLQNSGESTMMYDSRLLYISNLQLQVWTEWYEDTMLLPADNITINKE